MPENTSSADLQRREITVHMLLVIIALNDEAHAYGSMLETLEAHTKLKREDVIAALYRFQTHGILISQWSQEGTAGPIVERYRLTPAVKEVHLETKAGSQDGRNPKIGLYFSQEKK